jgi:sirohydrochlorin ferrochelatase
VRLRRRDPFDDLVERQLALFAEDETDLLSEATEAEQAWTRAGRDTAEEAYGDYQLVVDAIADRLLDLREAYAATLADDAVDGYRRAFAAGAARRFRRYASLVADLDP